MTNLNPQPPSEPKEAGVQQSGPASASDSGLGTPQGWQQWLAESESFVKLVAENLRYGSWTRRLVTVAGIAAVVLNPVSMGKVTEAFGAKALPKGYVALFWTGLGGLGVGTVVIAVATLPKRAGAKSEVATDESGAIKGLRSFELKDAEIFSRLQRRWDVKECYDSVTSPEFRLGVLMGESGCGKSSLLQAGLLPKLSGEAALYYGVYVKFGDLEPIAAIRTALKDLATDTEGDDLLEILQKAVDSAEKPIVLLFDQFEQFFVQYKQKSERVAFIQALKRWYDSEVSVRIFIGIRGDLADRLTEIQKVLGYSLGPEEIFRLEKFSPSEATAVLKVMAEGEGLLFDERFVTELVQDQLAGREDKQISPVDVQILAWMIARQSDDELRAFDQKAFQRLGGVEGLLQRFLERMLDKRLGQSQRELTLKVLLALTDRERNVRAGTLSLEALQTKLKGSGTGVDVAEAVEWLARGDVRLVTVVDRETERGYELAHERLILALLRVAKQELSQQEQANQLLDRRVNEWLGNNKSERYLFSWRELRLLQRYRGQDALVWGGQRQWKEELLLRSQRRIRRWIVIIAPPLMLGLLFIGWSKTTPGTIQWARWQLVLIGNGESIYFSPDESLNSLDKSISVNSAIAADAVAGIKNQPFPKLWIKWFVLEHFDSKAFSNIVKLTNELEPQTATQLLEQAYKVAEASRSASTNTRGAFFNSDKATAIANISEAYGNLKETAKSQEMLSQALKLTDSIEDERDKVDAMTAIAEAYGNLKETAKSQEMLSQALKLTDSFEDEGSKVMVMTAIAEAYGNLKETAKAQEMLSQALKLTDSIEGKWNKVFAITAIVEVAKNLKETAEAQEMLSQALKLTNSFESEENKVNAMAAIVEVAGSLKETAKAQEILSQALKLTDSIKDERDKVDAMKAIAVAHGNLKETAKAQEVLSQALKLTDSIEIEVNKVYYMTAIAEAYGNLKETAKAQEVLFQALKLTDSIEIGVNKVFSITAIAKAYGNLRETAKAQEMLSQALKLADSIESEWSKVYAMDMIAEAYIDLNDTAKAKKILKTIPKQRDFCSLSDTYSAVGDFGKAFYYAQHCPVGDGYKPRALAIMLTYHAEQINPELKKLREETAESSDD
jgi:tetratricopeptide (TPR) repeat protein